MRELEVSERRAKTVAGLNIDPDGHYSLDQCATMLTEIRPDLTYLQALELFEVAIRTGTIKPSGRRLQ